MSYFAIHRDLFEHRLWQRKPFGAGQAWVDLIGLAAWKERYSDRGELVKRGEVHTSQLWLARRWGWNRPKVQRFLNELKSFGEVAYAACNNRDSGGTKITICNYDTYQSNALQNDQSAIRERSEDDQTPCTINKVNKANKANKTTTADTALVEAIYAAYPKKAGRGAAVAAITKALGKVPAADLLAKVKAYAASRVGQDEKFTPHPATWFNQERWLDEAAAAPAQQTKAPVFVRVTTPLTPEQAASIGDE